MQLIPSKKLKLQPIEIDGNVKPDGDDVNGNNDDDNDDDSMIAGIASRTSGETIQTIFQLAWNATHSS